MSCQATSDFSYGGISCSGGGSGGGGNRDQDKIILKRKKNSLLPGNKSNSSMLKQFFGYNSVIDKEYFSFLDLFGCKSHSARSREFYS